MSTEEIINLIYLGSELRNLEYKSSMSWNEPSTKTKVIKAILSMSNIRDGGYLIFGVEDDSFKPVGMTDSDYDSFELDDIKSKVSSCADPYTDFEVEKIEYEGKKFIVFKINEFDKTPVLCKSGGPENILKVGGLYTRSKRMNESTIVKSTSDLRDIIELAVDKEIQKFVQRAMKAGILFSSKYPQNDSKLFRKQIMDIEK